MHTTTPWAKPASHPPSGAWSAAGDLPLLENMLAGETTVHLKKTTFHTLFRCAPARDSLGCDSGDFELCRQKYRKGNPEPKRAANHEKRCRLYSYGTDRGHGDCSYPGDYWHTVFSDVDQRKSNDIWRQCFRGFLESGPLGGNQAQQAGLAVQQR